MSADQEIPSEDFFCSASLLFSRTFCGQHSSEKQPQTDRQKDFITDTAAVTQHASHGKSQVFKLSLSHLSLRLSTSLPLSVYGC